MKSKLTSISIAILAALFIVSFSISLPILIRPFFYLQIDALGLTDEVVIDRAMNKTTLTKDEIRTAYDEMMDYCLGLRSDFSAGILTFSEEGESHFADVKILFIIDFIIICASAIGLAIIAIIMKVKKISPYRFLKRGPLFWSVISIASIASVIGIACAINFRETFIFFHKIFFIGKTNWSFNPHTDPIILLLPNQFFSNCGLLIFFGILLFSIAIMLYEFIPKRNKKITLS